MPRRQSTLAIFLFVSVLTVPATSWATVYRLSPDDDWFTVLSSNRMQPGDVGEAFYLGCNWNECQFFDGLIEGNYIHDLDGPRVSQGDGIEIKDGSYNNIVRDNVIHDTNYPGIIAYGTAGNGGRTQENAHGIAGQVHIE